MHSLSTWQSLLRASVVLADQGRIMEMGRRFRPGGSSVDVKGFVILLIVGGIVVLAIFALSRFFALRERSYTSQRGLFNELCRAHGLDWSSRRLLRKLARWHQLERPADLFTNPRRFATESLTGPLAEQGEQIAWLRDHVFADEPDESSVS